MNWNKYPFVRLVLALALGIVVYKAFGAWIADKALLYGALVALLGIEVLLSYLARTYRYRWMFGVATLLVFMSVGYFRASLQDDEAKEDDYSRWADKEGWFLARVADCPVEKQKTFKVLLDMKGFRSDSTMCPVSGRLLAYFQKTVEAKALRYGDLLAFPAPLGERLGTTEGVYLKANSWIGLGEKEANPVLLYASRFRERLLDALQQCGVTDDAFGVGAAILLGYDDSLSTAVKNSYVAAGSMHILCVSGMHVGIVYLLASFLLSFLGRGKRMVWIKKVILLLLIWLYAVLTGLSPSVMRSSLMLSFLIFGELIHRKGFALNSIAASAFLLLMIDPDHLFAIGFQLSYAAVVGIVLLQRPVYKLLFFKNTVLDKMWEITAVSLAAQLSTMPFTVYYFHQFTPYFWLSNLFMTPLSFVVILLGMLLLAVSWVPVLNAVMGKLVWASLSLMNGLVSWVEHLPLSLVKGLYMDHRQFVMSLLLLLLFWLFVTLKKKRMLMEMLVLSAVFAFTLAWRSQHLSRQSQLVVYSLWNHTAVCFTDGFNSVLLCDGGLLSDPWSIDYNLKSHWAERQLPMNPPCYLLEEDFDGEFAVKRKNMVSSHGRLLAFWDPVTAPEMGGRRIPVDYLMVRGKQRPELSRVAGTYEVGMLLIDGSVPEYLAQEWIHQAEAMQIPYYNVRNGPFLDDISI